MTDITRRGVFSSLFSAANKKKFVDMQFGLVTYLWGKDMDLPTLIDTCAKSGVLGVELRTTHKHGVERELSKPQRAEVKARFEASPVTLVGIGSNERYDNPDPAVLKKAIEATKAFIRLSHDVGGTGVKVKPDKFHKGVEHDKTIEQIGKSLAELGDYGGGFGQQIRLEVHGQCAELPTIKKIMEVANHWNARSGVSRSRAVCSRPIHREKSVKLPSRTPPRCLGRRQCTSSPAHSGPRAGAFRAPCRQGYARRSRR